MFGQWVNEWAIELLEFVVCVGSRVSNHVSTVNVGGEIHDQKLPRRQTYFCTLWTPICCIIVVHGWMVVSNCGEVDGSRVSCVRITDSLARLVSFYLPRTGRSTSSVSEVLERIKMIWMGLFARPNRRYVKFHWYFMLSLCLVENTTHYQTRHKWKEQYILVLPKTKEQCMLFCFTIVYYQQHKDDLSLNGPGNFLP